jgi:hypothetical protein
MDELNGDDDFLPSEFMPFLDDEPLLEGQGGPNMSWFDIEGLVGDLDSAMDNKLEGLFPMNGVGHQQHQQHQQHMMMGGMYGAQQKSSYNNGYGGGSEYPSPFNSPFSPSNHPGGLSRCNSVPVGPSHCELQGRVINNYHHHRMGAMRGGYMAGSPYPTPPPPPQLPPHLAGSNVNTTFFRASYEAYHSNNLNQTKSSNRIRAGFDALIDAFRSGRTDTKNRLMHGKGPAQTGKKNKKAGGEKEQNGTKEFMSKLKDAFTPQQQKVSPMPPQAATNTLSRSSSLKKKGSAKKPLGTMRNTSFKKENNGNGNTSSLARSYSDGPLLKSRSSSFGSGRRYSEYTVEGAIQSLLSGSNSNSSSQSQQQGLARTASFGQHLSRELSFFSNKSIEEEEEEGSGMFRDRENASGMERLSNDSPVDHFGTSGRELEQSLQKQRDKWGAFHPTTATNGKEEASYNLQDITKQLFSPTAVKDSKTSTYAKNNMAQTALSPSDLKKEKVGQKLVSRCLSSKW